MKSQLVCVKIHGVTLILIEIGTYGILLPLPAILIQFQLILFYQRCLGMFFVGGNCPDIFDAKIKCQYHAFQ